MMKLAFVMLFAYAISSYGALFTKVTNHGTPYLTTAIMNELADSINARIPVADTNLLVSTFSDGDNLQSASMWSNLQSTVIGLVTSNDGRGVWCYYEGLSTTNSTPVVN